MAHEAFTIWPLTEVAKYLSRSQTKVPRIKPILYTFKMSFQKEIILKELKDNVYIHAFINQAFIY